MKRQNKNKRSSNNLRLLQIQVPDSGGSRRKNIKNSGAFITSTSAFAFNGKEWCSERQRAWHFIERRYKSKSESILLTCGLHPNHVRVFYTSTCSVGGPNLLQLALSLVLKHLTKSVKRPVFGYWIWQDEKITSKFECFWVALISLDDTVGFLPWWAVLFRRGRLPATGHRG